MTLPEFKKFPKIPRFGKFYVTITEKIDGTNAGVFIDENGEISAASRKRWITPESDNFGFAWWVKANADELRILGPGMHWGEWWGQGIQRKYNINTRRFSLFDVSRYSDLSSEVSLKEFFTPACCHVVPVLDVFTVFSDMELRRTLERLRVYGSQAAPGFMDPEGIVISHNIKQPLYKLTFDNAHKGEQRDHENHTA